MVKKLSPVSRDRDIALPGSRSARLARLSCNREADVFNRHTGISAKRASSGSCNQPLQLARTNYFRSARSETWKATDVVNCCFQTIDTELYF